MQEIIQILNEHEGSVWQILLPRLKTFFYKQNQLYLIRYLAEKCSNIDICYYLFKKKLSWPCCKQPNVSKRHEGFVIQNAKAFESLFSFFATAKREVENFFWDSSESTIFQTWHFYFRLSRFTPISHR